MRQSGTMTPVPGAGGSGSFLSGTQTPSKSEPTPAELRAKIAGLVHMKQYNMAFQTALCAADLELLIDLCEQCQPSVVFEVIHAANKKSQCQLAQPVILSLIQQLSQDLNSHIELKMRYLEEAVFNLDSNNPLTREHTPQVLSQLIAKIGQYLQTHPTDKLAKPLRMLSLASESLLQKTTSAAYQKARGATSQSSMPTASASTTAIMMSHSSHHEPI